MGKSEVYSWRVAPETKGRLEASARALGVSIAEVVDRAVSAWLERNTRSVAEEDVQRRLHTAAREAMGTIRGRDPGRSARSKQAVRAIVRARHSRAG